jgi:ANTAR domain
VLTHVVHAAHLLIPHADVVSITLRRGEGDYYTPVWTDAQAKELDHLQYAFDEGPCLDAAEPDGPAYAHSGDLAGDSPWPEFGPAVAEQGYRSVLSTAMLTHPAPSDFTGALNIYGRDPGTLDKFARDVAFVLATYASFAVAAVRERVGAEHDLAKVRTEAANLRRALDTRTVIGQATGILMSRRGLTSAEAFEVLSRASQNHNVKLVDLAGLLTGHPQAADRL